MSCAELEQHLDAYLDGEVDAAVAARLDAHLATCASCRESTDRARRSRDAVRDGLRRFRAPDGLRDRIVSAIRQEARPAARRWRVPGALAAALLVGVLGGWVLRSRVADRGDSAALVDAIVSAHLRSLQGDHLTDVASSEHHTVKPWFAGRVDFSPPVPELEDSGFPLIGGRLDVIASRPVAALAYHGGAHVINLFVWPSGTGPSPAVSARARGFEVTHGVRDAMNYWIVSDLNPAELARFTRLVVRAMASDSAGQ